MKWHDKPFWFLLAAGIVCIVAQCMCNYAGSAGAVLGLQNQVWKVQSLHPVQLERCIDETSSHHEQHHAGNYHRVRSCHGMEP